MQINSNYHILLLDKGYVATSGGLACNTYPTALKVSTPQSTLHCCSVHRFWSNESVYLDVHDITAAFALQEK